MISLPQHIVVAAEPVGPVEKRRKAVGNRERWPRLSEQVDPNYKWTPACGYAAMGSGSAL